jgi:hypothetical protein
MIGTVIAARLAAATNNRVYPLILPQNPTLPAATYTTVGTSSISPTLQTIYLQVDLWAASYSAVQTLAAAAKQALHKYAGTVGSVTVRDSILTTADDHYEPDTRLYRVSQDYIFYIEA